MRPRTDRRHARRCNRSPAAECGLTVRSSTSGGRSAHEMNRGPTAVQEGAGATQCRRANGSVANVAVCRPGGQVAAPRDMRSTVTTNTAQSATSGRSVRRRVLRESPDLKTLRLSAGHALPKGASSVLLSIAPPEISSEFAKEMRGGQYNGSDQVAATAVGTPIVAAGSVVASGVKVLRDMKKSKVPTSDAPVVCDDCRVSHLVMVVEGRAHAPGDGHVVSSVFRDVCGRTHQLPERVSNHVNVRCRANPRALLRT